MDSNAGDVHSALLHEFEIAEALRREIQGMCSDIADLIEIQDQPQIQASPLEVPGTDRGDGNVSRKIATIQTNPRLMTISSIMARLKY